MVKPVQLRRLAANDIDDALTHYLAEAGSDVATRFIGAVERSLRHVARHPHNGSLRLSYELDLPGLRYLAVPKFPYLVFYVERAEQIDVWRVLHARRDLGLAFADPDDQ